MKMEAESEAWLRSFTFSDEATRHSFIDLTIGSIKWMRNVRRYMGRNVFDEMVGNQIFIVPEHVVFPDGWQTRTANDELRKLKL